MPINQPANPQPQQPVGRADSPMQRMVFNMLYRANPQFRQFADGMRSQNPQQACEEQGLDYNQVQNTNPQQIMKMFGM